MIDFLRIEGLGVIAEAELAVGPGLTALTGETGAGKTMAVDSLRLLMGHKADAGRVRAGHDAAYIEGSFTFPADSPAARGIDEAGGVLEGDDENVSVLAARSVPAQGRSRAFLGGHSVPAAILESIIGELVIIHGQADQMHLARPSAQREALDTYAGATADAARALYREAYEAFQNADKALEEFEASAADAARERLALEALVAKIDEVQPEEGEEERLSLLAQRLENAGDLYAAYDGASALLRGSDDVEESVATLLARASRLLEGTDDTALASRLASLEAELSDVASELAERARECEGDPERLHEVYARRQELQGLRKALGMNIDDAVREAERAHERLAALADPEAERTRLEANLRAAGEELQRTGAALRAVREKAAAELEQAIQGELSQLALADARLHIEVREAPASRAGMDEVRFLLATHREAPLAPVGDAASGGELSRIMLALEVCLAERGGQSSRTYLFDEVDAGVGGKAALAVGARLARLAQSHQVIVVTHLAQVAAAASTHLRVEKTGGGREETVTHVTQVSGEDRVAELARMLSGSDSVTALAHAAELLAGQTVA